MESSPLYYPAFCRGFTLVELLIAVAISAILLAAFCVSFNSQHRTRSNQQQRVEIQQSVRAAFNMIQTDIRMAGYDAGWVDGNADGIDDLRTADGIDNDCDGGADGADPGDDEARDLARFTMATAGRVGFLCDRNHDGDFCDPEDRIGIGFAAANDGDGDGAADAGSAQLGRSLGRSHLQPMAEDIQAVAFAFAFDCDGSSVDGDDRRLWAYDADGDSELDTLLDSNGDGTIDAADDLDGDGRINDLALDPAVPIDRIRAARVWLLARTRSPLRGHRDQGTYVVGDKVIFASDDHGRVLLETVVHCRNLGLR
jgi:type IV pilus assembly protein PilW